ncbi:MAG TPA: DNA-directed RNA polymerase subunit beta, partial [candidate division WOR-3 bacterium]|nr:DNA-directed RNA polymerase subunit beta [candidate division WOR-3 bacterium]
YEVEVRETKLGPEEITRDLPNVSEEELKNLDDNGIVRIGAEVKPGDILVGKVTPKGERELTPEERLIYAIFSEKAKDVRDTSKRVPPGVTGVVVDVVVLSRRKDDPLSIKVTREKKLEAERRAEAARKQVREKLKEKIKELLVGEKLKKSLRAREGRILKRQGEKIDSELFEKFHPIKINFDEDIIEDAKKLELVRALLKEAQELERKIMDRMNMEIEQIERGDELPPGVLQLVKVYVAQKRKLQVGDKLSGRHGNKGVVAKITPQEDMPFLDDGTPVDVVLNPLGVPSRMNVGQILETILGWAGKEKGVYYACPVFEGFSPEQISKELKSAGLPEDGKVRIRDGKSGEYLDFPVTVGYMYIMKLVHMVEDKVHARAIGPYSLITQQPVGGKAHFGGQRFGEMEVWALEAYGAAYTLQEMLTYKSDDIKGRNELYAAIIKGKEPPEPGIPASFDVLLKHLRGLGLDVELETEE